MLRRCHQFCMLYEPAGPMHSCDRGRCGLQKEGRRYDSIHRSMVAHRLGELALAHVSHAMLPCSQARLQWTWAHVDVIESDFRISAGSEIAYRISFLIALATPTIHPSYIDTVHQCPV